MKEKVKSIIIAVLAVALAVSAVMQIAALGAGVQAPSSSPSVVSSEPPPVSIAAPEEPMPEVESEAEPEEGMEDNIPLEIERKFLVDAENLPSQVASPDKKYTIVQTYVSLSPEIRVRRIGASSYTYHFAIKMPRDETGLSRAEIDFAIDKQAYEYLLEMKMGETIYKTRYQFYEGNTYVYLDVYSEQLEGLAVVEVQFESVKEADAFVPPTWFGPDVTEDSRYKNAQLATNGMPDPKVLEV